jgi:hypothetical protein
METAAMPMIDIYATRGTFQDVHQLAIDAAAVVKGVEGVPTPQRPSKRRLGRLRPTA